MLTVGVLTELAPRERRVALTPDGVARLQRIDVRVLVQSGAGTAAGFTDDAYAAAGADVGDRARVLADASTLLQVRGTGTHEVDDGVDRFLGPETTVIGLVEPLWQPSNAARIGATGATVLALELVPRITRAQSMDVLSSMATVAGYQAALVAALRAPRMFPMLMTAAGTVPPSKARVLGAGVAGLQAIATAKRIGAVVEAYDVRSAAVEQIRSVGARAIEFGPTDADAEDADGYARSQSTDENERQQELLAPAIAANDVVITTAAIPGAASPRLVSAAAVAGMAPGSVIVDLAAERGGNCEITVADAEVDHGGVLVLGPTDLVSRSARTSSQMLSNNLVTLVEHLVDEGDLVIDPDDEIAGAMIVASGGTIVHERVQALLEAGTASAGQV